jgi:chlorobactene glucosyltransferase
MIGAALWAAIVLGGLGLFCAVANLLLLPRLSAARGGPGETLRVSVVIPARNEERDVEATVSAHLAQTYPNFEVIVVDDRSTDATGAILDRLSSRDPRLRVLRSEEPPAGWLGKPNALALGAREASGEVLLFADADVRYDPRTLSEAIGFLEANRLDFLALIPRFEVRGFWERVLMPYLIGAVFFAPAFLANRRARWVAIGGGAGNLIRRRVYEAVGGHGALRDSVIDDVRLAYRVKAAGFHIGLALAEDRIFVRMYRGFREIFDGFTKNTAYVFDGRYAVPLFVWTAAMLGFSVLPTAVLAAAPFGIAGATPGNVRLAVAAFAVSVAGRALVAAGVGDRIWPAFAHPVTAGVWSAILARSLFHRFVRRRLLWRGREFDARGARF